MPAGCPTENQSADHETVRAGVKVPEIKLPSRTNSVASLGSRPASVRGSRAAGLQSRSNSAATLAAAASALGSGDSGPCLLVSDRKDDRAKKVGKLANEAARLLATLLLQAVHCSGRMARCLGKGTAAFLTKTF